MNTNRLSWLLAAGYLALLAGWMASVRIERWALREERVEGEIVPCMHQPQCPIAGTGRVLPR